MQALNGEGNDSRTHWQRPDAPLGTLIFREGLLSAEQLEDSLGEAVKTGKRLGQVLVDKGLLQEGQVARIIAKQKGLGFVNLAELQIDPDTARLLPHETAWLHHALPIAVEDDLVVVAVEDPADEEALDTVKAALGREARFVVATRSEILRVLDELSSQKAPQPVPSGLLEVPTLNGNGLADQSPSDPEPDARPAPMTVELSPLRIAEPEPEYEPEPEPEPEPAAVEAMPQPEPRPQPTAAEAPEPAPEPAAVEAMPQPEPQPQPTAAEAPEPAPEPAGVEAMPQPEPQPQPTAAEGPEPAPEAQPVAVEAPEPAPEPVPVAEFPSAPEVAPAEPALSPKPVPVAPTTVPEPPVGVPKPPVPAAVEPEPVQPAAFEPAPPAETPAPSGQPPVAAPAEPDPLPGAGLHAVEPATPGPVPQLRPPAPPEPDPPVVEEHPTPAQPVVAGSAPASGGEEHEVVVRLTDGEVVSAGSFPSRDVAKDAAKILTRQIASSPAGEWPEIGGRFVRPDLIVSVDVV